MLFFIFMVPIANAQTHKKNEYSVRLGMSTASYDFGPLNEPNINFAIIFDPLELISSGVRFDFSGESFYFTMFQVEIGPKFLKAGTGIIMGNIDRGIDKKVGDGMDLMIPLTVTAKPINWIYLQARWAPLLSLSRSTFSQNRKNFSDISAGLQFNF